ncbi:hypothetical protein O181_066322 [Austropuccinia psidii MF-1]|uniref:Uncharacterized protein n=1 Tax=Austropuccinia psidii MF-1 TaxID=1389203 RepID=A0A9Q3EYY1_9BASI|nr:hypothetical protein [Austropuccinia psidii MF-1]
MEDSRASTSFPRLSSTFDTLIESPEAEITAITVFRPETFPTGSNRDIPVSIQELVCGCKSTGVGTSAKSLDRHNELTSASEEVNEPRKDRGPSEGLDTHFLPRKSPTNKSFVEKSKHFVRGPEAEVGPRERKQPSGSSPSLHRKESAPKSAKKRQANPKEQSEGQAKIKGTGKTQVEQILPTELQNTQKRKDSHGECVQYGKNFDIIQKQGEERMNQSFPNK